MKRITGRMAEVIVHWSCGQQKEMGRH